MKPFRVFALASIILLSAILVTGCPTHLTPSPDGSPTRSSSPTATRQPTVTRPPTTSPTRLKLNCILDDKLKKRVCPSIPPAGSAPSTSDSFRIVLDPALAQKVVVEQVAEQLNDALKQEMYSKPPSDFKPNRVVGKFTITTSDGQRVVNFNPPIEIWIELTEADTKFAGSAQSVRFAFLVDDKKQWILSPAQSLQDYDGRTYVVATGIQTLGDPFIVAGD